VQGKVRKVLIGWRRKEGERGGRMGRREGAG